MLDIRPMISAEVQPGRLMTLCSFGLALNHVAMMMPDGEALECSNFELSAFAIHNLNVLWSLEQASSVRRCHAESRFFTSKQDTTLTLRLDTNRQSSSIDVSRLTLST